MNYKTCHHCNGTGIEMDLFRGYWADGEECWESIRCYGCDGFGTLEESDYNVVLGDN